MSWLGTALLVASAIGLAAVVLMRLVVAFATRRPTPPPASRPAFSVLKPLCGVDDELEENLACFAALDWPRYEVLLGVKDASDPAYAVAVRAARRWPGLFRVVLQEGAPGLNPKVNQLVTLARHARHELIVISDSNVRVPRGYLAELATLFEDPWVGCVTNPVSGQGHASFGALLDNLHLAAAIGPGQISSKAFADKAIVVGKSMALRRSVIDRLGGLEAYADILAEDYVIGQQVTGVLGLEVKVAKLPVMNVAVTRGVRAFVKRYERWSIIHRTAITLPTYLAQALLNPWPLAVAGAVLAPSKATATAALLVFLLKALVDFSAARSLGFKGLGVTALFGVAAKDLIVFVAWLNGLFARSIDWRGNRLRVGHGSRLALPVDEAEAEPASEVAR